MPITNDEVIGGGGRGSCGCRHQFAIQSNRVAIFENLDCAKSYYPMIALNGPRAIYGLPPQEPTAT